MRFVLILAVAQPAATCLQAQVIRRDYTGFTLWIDCSKRGPVIFEYRLGKDTANFKRGRYKNNFPADDSCEPTSTAAYSPRRPKVPTTGSVFFDWGHMVPNNHVDSTKFSAADSDHMVNIMPQTKALNRCPGPSTGPSRYPSATRPRPTRSTSPWSPDRFSHGKTARRPGSIRTQR